MKVTATGSPGTGTGNAYYPSNRPPLQASPLAKLPLGSIRPRGWLKGQLDLMARGMTGRLAELSRFLRPDNGWFGGENEGWEEQPYWFRGFYDLAALTGDEGLLTEAKRWIEAVLTSQDEDGYFGAQHHKRVVLANGQEVCDLWPHMVMLDAVRSHYELTGDERVIPFMTRFFHFCRSVPDDMFMPPPRPNAGGWKPFVQYDRASDMLPHIYWLYNHTGEDWLLDLATRFFQATKPAEDEWLDHHIVNFTQRFQYPGCYFQQSGERRHLEESEYWYAQHMATWGQQPRGIFAADERVRPGKTDPRQGFETCGMVEFAKSFYILGRATGDPLYADRCEDVMLNHFPVASTPDLKALKYLTAANQPQLDASEKHDFYNKGRQVCYSPHIYRCCQHNVAMGWPWYAENLWQATADNGLAAWLYAASEVSARVGTGGREVIITSETDYPFRGSVTLTIETEDEAEFPLYLRVPRWCEDFQVSVNGEPVEVIAEPGCFVRVERPWADGDIVGIEMGMALAITEWPRTGSVTVDRGPLSYSLKIAERWQRCGGTDEWPEWEVLPASPWNYGIIIDRENPAASLVVAEVSEVPEQPWTLESAPIAIRAQGKRIPAWGLRDETVEELSPSPVRSDEPVEEITLIPLGCARLRISCLPVIGEGSDARQWQKQGRFIEQPEL